MRVCVTTTHMAVTYPAWQPPSLPPSSLLPESPNPFFSGTDAELGVSSHCFRQHFRRTGEGSLKQNMKPNTPLAAHVGALKGRAPERSCSYMHAQTCVCAELRQPYCVWSTSFQPWKKVSHKSPTKSTSMNITSHAFCLTVSQPRNISGLHIYTHTHTRIRTYRWTDCTI